MSLIRRAFRRLIPKRLRRRATGGRLQGPISDSVSVPLSRGCGNLDETRRELERFIRSGRPLAEPYYLLGEADEGLHPASHLEDVLSGHRSRIVHEYRGKGHARKNALQRIIQDATDSFLESYEQVWQEDYEDDDTDDLSRFIAACIDDYLSESQPETKEGTP